MRALIFLLIPTAAAASELPAFFTIPSDVGVEAVETQEWGESSFRLNDDLNIQRGKRWTFVLNVPGLPDDAHGRVVWPKLAPALERGGWTVAKLYDINPTHLTLRLKKDKREAWAFLWVLGPSDVRVELVEVGPQPIQHAFKAPAKTPEKIADDKGDYPFLPPLAGSSLSAAERVETPLIAPTDAAAEREELLAMGYHHRAYMREGLSNIQAVTVFRAALSAVGWDVLHVGQALGRADYVMVAHYAKNGRDLWLVIRGGGPEYQLQLADAGASDLAKALAEKCRAPLYGVLFDHDKSTINPSSDSVLTRAKDAILANPKLTFEVEGHTDSSGADAYNAKLSEERARSVMAWLTGHGVPGARLTAKGYGEGRPVDSNDSPEGRAKNRRVELSCKK